MVCFGNMFVELPKARAKEMMQKGTETPIRMERSRVRFSAVLGSGGAPKCSPRLAAAIATLPWAHIPGHILARCCQGFSACRH